MPYKKGFRSPFHVAFHVVNVGALEARFEDGAHVTLETLQAAGLAPRREKRPLKLLSDGAITKRLVVRVDRASAQARAKIEAAGGSVEETLPRKKTGAADGTDRGYASSGPAGTATDTGTDTDTGAGADAGTPRPGTGMGEEA